VQSLLEIMAAGVRDRRTREQRCSWIARICARYTSTRASAWPPSPPRRKFSREHATKLLLTLWDNLQKNGERSSDELSRLALMLLVDSDPSQRTAACRQLLSDARYRDLVLSWLRERNDQTVANEIAWPAPHELPRRRSAAGAA
jgi:hypothetical protein